MTYIEEPNENDILLGRGGKNNQWTGNDRLRTMAQRRCIEYETAQKRAKSVISRELVQGVQNLDPPGRFLRECSNTKGSVRWEVATDKVAREKTSQVLRDANEVTKSTLVDDEDKCNDDQLQNNTISTTITPINRHPPSPSHILQSNIECRILDNDSCDNKAGFSGGYYDSDCNSTDSLKYEKRGKKNQRPNASSSDIDTDTDTDTMTYIEV